MRTKKPLLLLVLLAAAAAELEARNVLGTGAQALRGRQSDDQRVRLCDRDFIRAIVFTCGGSRTKRLSEPLLGDGTRRAESVQSNSNRGTEDIKLQSASDPELEQPQHIGQPTGLHPLKLLFNFYGDYNAYVPTSDNLSEYIHQRENAVQQSKGGPGLKKRMKSNNFPWVSSSRRKRDSTAEMAEMCCRRGCTMTEIGTLC